MRLPSPLSLVKDLYQSGLTQFQNVLDMERSLAQQDDNLAVESRTAGRRMPFGSTARWEVAGIRKTRNPGSRWKPHRTASPQ